MSKPENKFFPDPPWTQKRPDIYHDTSYFPDLNAVPTPAPVRQPKELEPKPELNWFNILKETLKGAGQSAIGQNPEVRTPLGEIPFAAAETALAVPTGIGGMFGGAGAQILAALYNLQKDKFVRSPKDFIEQFVKQYNAAQPFAEKVASTIAYEPTTEGGRMATESVMFPYTHVAMPIVEEIIDKLVGPGIKRSVDQAKEMWEKGPIMYPLEKTTELPGKVADLAKQWAGGFKGFGGEPEENIPEEYLNALKQASILILPALMHGAKAGYKTMTGTQPPALPRGAVAMPAPEMPKFNKINVKPEEDGSITVTNVAQPQPAAGQPAAAEAPVRIFRSAEETQFFMGQSNLYGTQGLPKAEADAKAWQDVQARRQQAQPQPQVQTTTVAATGEQGTVAAQVTQPWAKDVNAVESALLTKLGLPDENITAFLNDKVGRKQLRNIANTVGRRQDPALMEVGVNTLRTLVDKSLKDREKAVADLKALEEKAKPAAAPTPPAAPPAAAPESATVTPAPRSGAQTPLKVLEPEGMIRVKPDTVVKPGDTLYLGKAPVTVLKVGPNQITYRHVNTDLYGDKPGRGNRGSFMIKAEPAPPAATAAPPTEATPTPAAAAAPPTTPPAKTTRKVAPLEEPTELLVEKATPEEAASLEKYYNDEVREGKGDSFVETVTTADLPSLLLKDNKDRFAKGEELLPTVNGMEDYAAKELIKRGKKVEFKTGPRGEILGAYVGAERGGPEWEEWRKAYEEDVMQEGREKRTARIAGKKYTFPEQKITTNEQVYEWLADRDIDLLRDVISEERPEGVLKPSEIANKLLDDPDFWKLNAADRGRIYSIVESPQWGKEYGPTKTVGTNLKTAWKTGDTWRGCDNNCPGCFAKKMSYQARKLFGRPMRTILKGRLKEGEILRLGEVGDPAGPTLDPSVDGWKWTVAQVKDFMERSFEGAGREDVYYITKLQRIDGLDPAWVKNLQVSLDPLRPDHLEIAMRNISTLKSQYPDMNIVLRIRSIHSRDPIIQKGMMDAARFANSLDLKVLETRLRFNNRNIMKALDLDDSKYPKYHNQWRGEPALRDTVKKGNWELCDWADEACRGCKNCLKLSLPERMETTNLLKSGREKQAEGKVEYKVDPKTGNILGAYISNRQTGIPEGPAAEANRESYAAYMREQNKKTVAEERAKQAESKEYLGYLEERKAAGVEYPTTEPIPAPLDVDRELAISNELRRNRRKEEGIVDAVLKDKELTEEQRAYLEKRDAYEKLPDVNEPLPELTPDESLPVGTGEKVDVFRVDIHTPAGTLTQKVLASDRPKIEGIIKRQGAEKDVFIGQDFKGTWDDSFDGAEAVNLVREVVRDVKTGKPEIWMNAGLNLKQVAQNYKQMKAQQRVKRQITSQQLKQQLSQTPEGRVELKLLENEEALAAKRRWTPKKLYRAAKRELVDVAGNVKNFLLKEFGDEGRKVVMMHDLNAGATPKAKMLFDKAYDEIYSGYHGDNKTRLNHVITVRREIQVAKNKPGIKNPHGTVEDMTAWLKKNATPEDMKRADQYFGVMRDQLEQLHDAEIISDEAYSALIKSGDYAKREFIQHIDPVVTYHDGKGPITVHESGLKALDKGSYEALETDTGALMAQVMAHTQNRIFANEANRQLGEFARQVPGNGFVEAGKPVKITSSGRVVWQEPPSGWTTVHYLEDGHPRQILMNKEWVREWVMRDPAMNQQIATGMGWALGVPVLKAFATGYNPGFAFGNLPRDIGHVFMTTSEFSKHVPAYTYQMLRNLGKVAKDAWQKKGRWVDYINEGGGMDWLTYQGQHKTKIPVLEGFRKVAGKLGEFSEVAVRLALREQALRNGKSPKEATWIARDYMDFAQGGRTSKVLDHGVPYFGAGVQATRGIFRYAAKEPGVFAYKVGQIAAMATGLFVANNLGNPEGMAQVTTNEKNNNWIIMPPAKLGLKFQDRDGNTRWFYIKIPKDQGQRWVSSVSDALASKAMGIDFDPKQVVRSIKDALPPLPDQANFPPALKALIGATSNIDLYTGQQIAQDFREVEPRMERDVYTPPAAEKVGDIFGVSPQRFNYVLKQYFTGNNIWSSLTSMGLNKLLDEDNEGIVQKHIVEQFMDAMPDVRRIFSITQPYSPKEIEDVKQVGVKEATERKEQRLDLEKTAMQYWRRAKEEGVNDKEILGQARDYVMSQPPEDRERLKDYFNNYGVLYSIPDRRWYLQLVRSSLSPEAKADAWYAKYAEAKPEKQKEMEELLKQIPSLHTERFIARLRQLMAGVEIE